MVHKSQTCGHHLPFSPSSQLSTCYVGDSVANSLDLLLALWFTTRTHTHTHTPRGVTCSGITEAVAQFPLEATEKRWACKLTRCPAESPTQSRAGFSRHCLSPFTPPSSPGWRCMQVGGLRGPVSLQGLNSWHNGVWSLQFHLLAGKGFQSATWPASGSFHYTWEQGHPTLEVQFPHI